MGEGDPGAGFHEGLLQREGVGLLVAEAPWSSMAVIDGASAGTDLGD
ncbi:hypothetical protein HMPREF1129_0342 [Actinomyces naeslundii str. Howell 279]|uniref:Uncharacterized protein n=1 Tax=Actinomyces naeslundii (strain ATCC 12104 / DSM 43013 / CCUG 2238 / JCM 8349 / NCTC 10301 / Howell 279) TaxID=1115803 RepID=J3JJ75_ACTNH|nr:hypothetical protein HMPREF1129_0342 [Actinomyces naeslundii str. Howell 279]